MGKGEKVCKSAGTGTLPRTESKGKCPTLLCLLPQLIFCAPIQASLDRVSLCTPPLADFAALR